jgi:dihydroflavonol-4-reductase
MVALEKLIKEASVIIHCASIISIGNRNINEVYDINVNGTKLILQACQTLTIKLIYISSSVAVKETADNSIFNENRPYKTKEDFSYDYTKALSEQLVLEEVKSNHLDAIIIRPTSIVGPPDYRPSYFGKAIKDLASLTLPVVISGGYNLVDVRDLSQSIINSIEKGVKGEIYLLGGTYLSLKQMAEIANPNRRYFSLPLNLLIWLLPVINAYQKMFPLKWPITKESLLTLKRAPKHIDCSKAVKHLNHKIRPVSDTITDLMEWFNKGTAL